MYKELKEEKRKGKKKEEEKKEDQLGDHPAAPKWIGGTWPPSSAPSTATSGPVPLEDNSRHAIDEPQRGPAGEAPKADKVGRQLGSCLYLTQGLAYTPLKSLGLVAGSDCGNITHQQDDEATKAARSVEGQEATIGYGGHCILYCYCK